LISSPAGVIEVPMPATGAFATLRTITFSPYLYPTATARGIVDQIALGRP